MAASAQIPASASFPRLRWLGVPWLVVYLPAYAQAWGVANFLFLCNIGVILTAIGLVFRSRLLISSQAVAAPVIALVWLADAGWRLATGDFLFGGTRYMWDEAFPLFTRLLSLYHLFWPLLLAWVLSRTGYDHRGWAVQAGIAGLAMVAGRWLGPAVENINYAWKDPFFGMQFGPAPLHLLVCWALLAGVAYGATHWLLKRSFPQPVR